MPTCTAFTQQSTPCTSNIREGETLCGRHRHMIDTEQARARFQREQAIFRANWEGLQAGTHVRVGTRIVPVNTPLAAAAREPPPPPRVRTVCIAVKANGVPCSKFAEHDDHKCNLHHGVALRALQNNILDRGYRELRNIYDMFRFSRAVYTATVAEAIPRLMEGLTENNQRRLQAYADELYLRPMFQQVIRVIEQGATFEQADAQVQAWVADGVIPMAFIPRLHDVINRRIIVRQWEQENRRPAQFGAHQREAQLAADSQNVHTREITQQMRDSVNILLAVKVPAHQISTLGQIRQHFIDKAYPVHEVNPVLTDIVNWWNKDTIFAENDKLYRKMLRALWWTVNQYKDEVREELQKRLWEELKDGAIPYSVCTQGHVARLSNVMIGFDDAFVPPVPVGEILQQKMAAIYGMDVDYEEQMRLAEAVLEELKIPREQHAEWLSAF